MKKIQCLDFKLQCVSVAADSGRLPQLPRTLCLIHGLSETYLDCLQLSRVLSSRFGTISAVQRPKRNTALSVTIFGILRYGQTLHIWEETVEFCAAADTGGTLPAPYMK